MIWVGLTGGIGTGKSTVTRILRQLGIPVIDADHLAKEVVKAGTEGYAEVVKAFGADSIRVDGELDRKKIAAQVFADKNKLSLLESIIHPKVRSLTLQKKAELESQGTELAFYDVPLLFEKKMESLFDQIVVVTCDLAIQKLRLVERDGFSEEEAMKRIANQLPLEQKVKAAHFTIENNGTIAELEKRVSELVQKLRTLG
jgi:dephospho-CoA kinase